MIDFSAIVNTALFAVALVVAIGGFTRGVYAKIDKLAEKVHNQDLSLVRLEKEIETFSKKVS